MHVIAFAPSLRAALDEQGGVSAAGFPMTSCTVDGLPARIGVQVVLAVWAQNGTDYRPRRFIVARSPAGESVGSVVCDWHWPDEPGAAVKFRVLVAQLSMQVNTVGTYGIGLYDNLEDAETDQVFPLPVRATSPLALTPLPFSLK